MVRFQREGFKRISYGVVPFVLLFIMLKDTYLNNSFEVKSLNMRVFFFFTRILVFLGNK